MQATAHPAFESIRQQSIDSLNVTVEEYRHTKTGAQHIHIQADNPENVFLVALRTVPMDSSGVAHILEHTALCGSEKYPVRDPFFMMIRRSLNTFMNAFTSSDWTAYPFASQNRKDFNNLLDVYLDAVFFSRLDPLDFAQEGHRVEFEKADDPTTPLVYKGVVFNEMKGAMSSIPSQLWHTMCKYLFPTTTYHYNSGGDPEAIPDLSYEQLKSFYKNHYHPSNAIFMTFGDIPAVEHQEKFEKQALSRFEKLNYRVDVGEEKRYHAPIKVQEFYPLDDAEDSIENKTHVVMAWLLGPSIDLDSVLKAQLLNSILLDNSASPLQHLLETTELGSSPSPLCGLDDSQKDLSFLCGIEGSDSNKVEEFEQQILGLFEKIAEEGVSEEQLEACLHQLELHQREIGGDSYPYGLQLILSALNSATHRGDPISLLDIEPAFARLREAAKEPNFVQNLARELLVDNPHRVTLVMSPDSKINARKTAAEKARLAKMQSSLSDDDKHNIVDLAARLVERQNQVDDESILPKVTVADVPEKTHYVAGNSSKINNHPLTVYTPGTNGLVYQQIIVKLPELTTEELQLLPLYSICLTELGVGEKDYLAAQQWQAQVAGGFSAFCSIRGTISDVQDISGHLTLSGKALFRNQMQLAELMKETLESVRFDELNRIKELVAQVRARKEMSVTGSGHSLAMSAAASGISAGAKISHQLTGLEGIRFIKALDDDLKNPEQLSIFAEKLATIHNKIKQQEQQYFLAAEPHNSENCIKNLEKVWSFDDLSGTSEFNYEITPEITKEAWITNTQVNFCAKAYPTVAVSHPDAPALTVLSGFLRNGYLHRCIREQGGAYGGGASQDSNTGSFRFFSYRDPRLEETLCDFDESLQWLLTHDHTAQSLEEAILGVIASLDKPSSPAGEAKQTFHAELFGRDQKQREEFRKGILATTLDDLKRVAKTYLTTEKASTAVITNADQKPVIEKLGLSLKKL